MNKLLFISVFLGFTFSLPGFGQKFPADLWHDGRVTLENGEVVKGLIKYNLKLNAVNVDLGLKVAAYTAKQVERFEIADKTTGANRYFYSLPFALTGDYKSPVFFEVLHEGSVSLLCIEKIVNKTINDPYYYNRSFSQQVLDYDFYYLRERDQIRRFADRRNELLDVVLRDKAVLIKKFIRRNRLRDDNRYDLTLIFQYYNGLIN